MSTATECRQDLKRLVPLTRVVAAALIDTREDIGRCQQSYSHWAARGLKKLTRETLKTGVRRATLLVNKSTNSATLPPDFDSETYVGIIDQRGLKVPLKVNNRLVDFKNIEAVACEDRCTVCNQDKQICQDLTVTEETTLVDVNGVTAQQTVIKKLYPDGTYYLETRIPVWDVDSAGIIYTTTKEFITTIDLKPCGCIDDTPANVEKIRCCAYDVWCSYYAGCDNNCYTDYGGYRIFEDTGLIYFDRTVDFERVYMEYRGFMNKINGQWYIPEVAMETLVELVKYKSIQNKINIPDRVIDRWFNNYTRERGNMNKVLGRVSLAQIITSVGIIPKFDLDYSPAMWCGSSIVSYSTVTGASAAAAAAETAAIAAAEAAAEAESETEGCNDAPLPEVECPCPPATPIKTPFQLAVICGVGSGPTAGVNTYTNTALIDALDLNKINVNNVPETILGLQFTFNATTGTITRYQGDGVTPNLWQSGDILVINYAKIV